MIFAAKEAVERKSREKARIAEEQRLLEIKRAEEFRLGLKREIMADFTQHLKRDFIEDFKKSFMNEFMDGFNQGFAEGRAAERKRIRMQLEQSGSLTPELAHILSDEDDGSDA